MGQRKQQLQRIGSLECLHIPGDDGGPLVVVFHGYGADAWDLASLSQELNIPGATWVFPNGHLEVPIGPGWMGRAWFNIDVQALEQAMATGTHRDLSDTRPPGVDKALEKSTELMQALRPDEHSKVVVGGFSQGAMLTMETLLSSDFPVDAAVLLSGTLLDQANWKSKLRDRKPLPFFQSHGKQDPLLAFTAAQKLEQLLKEGGWQGSLRAFNGGHEIPYPVIQELKSFLNKVTQNTN